MVKKTDNYTFLTTGPVGKVILTMSVPTVISMLVTSIYNIVDTYFVGLLNTQATAAVGVVFPVMAIIQAVGFFFGQGSGAFISRRLGAKDTNGAAHMASIGFYCSIVSGLLITALGLIFLEPLSVFLGSTPTILPYTKTYLGVILLGAPFMTGSMVLNNQMRYQGNAGQAMYGMMSGAVMNVILVPLFMFVFDLGILGTAIGTVLSQAIGFTVLVIMSMRGENIHLKISNISTDAYYYKEIFKDGTPSLTRQGLASVATILLNLAAGVYGDAAIAGMSIVGRISFVVFATIIGIGQGFQPFCGFNYGAGLYHRVSAGYFFSIKASMVFLAFCCVGGYFFADQIIDILRHDSSVVVVGGDAFRYQILTYPLAAVITISNMALQTSGRTIPANILAASRNGLFFIPLIIILPKLFGLKGVEICQSVADICTFMLTVPIMANYLRSLRKREGEA